MDVADPVETSSHKHHAVNHTLASKKQPRGTGTPKNQFFQLVNNLNDYIEFIVSYHIGENHWVVDGIGWLSNGSPSYYLHHLRLNCFTAAGVYYGKALIVEQDSSLRFGNKVLDELALSRVHQIFNEHEKRNGMV